MRLIVVFSTFLFWAGWSLNVHADESTLDAIRREVREPDQSHDNDRPKPACPPKRSVSIGWFQPSSDECEDDSESLTAWIVLRGLTAPWWVPYLALEGDGRTEALFPSGPYADDRDGYLIVNPEDATHKRWGGRIAFDSGRNFDDITTLSGRVRLDSSSRLGVDAEWVYLQDDTPGRDDGITLGDMNFVYRFAQSPRAQFHSGLGINWLDDQGDTEVGWNFTYGADQFPVDPVVVSSTLDLGNVGGASLVHFRGTLGAMVTPQMHIYTGYDLRNLEGTRVHSWISGLEIWF